LKETRTHKHTHTNHYQRGRKISEISFSLCLLFIGWNRP